MGHQDRLDASDQALLETREAEMTVNGELDETTTMQDVNCLGQCSTCHFEEHCQF